MSRIEIGETVYHKDIDNGQTPVEIVGIRRNEVELACNSFVNRNVNWVNRNADWYSTEGVLFEKPKENLDIDINSINGNEIIDFIKAKLDEDAEELCDLNFGYPEFVDQKIVDGCYILEFNAYYNNWGTDQLIEGNKIRIKNGKVSASFEEPFCDDGTESVIVELLTNWLKTHKFSSREEIKSLFGDIIQNCFEELGGIRYSDKAGLERIIKELNRAKALMK